MLEADTVDRLRERLSTYGNGVISLYLAIDRKDPDANTTKAWALRARAAMEGLELDARTVKRITMALQDRLALEPGPLAAVFAHLSDEELFELVSIERELPALDLQDGAKARLGAPLLAPLELAQRQRPVTLALHVGQERIRRFVVSPTEVEELATEIDTSDESSWRDTRGSPAGDPSERAHASTGRESFVDRAAAWADRLRKRVAEETGRLLKQHGATSLMLLGTEPEVAAFEEHLDAETRKAIGARFPSFPDPDAPSATLKPRLQAAAAEAQQAGQMALLARAEEQSATGLAKTLELVAEGRVYLLLVPSRPTARVQRLKQSGLVYAHGAARFAAVNEPLEEVELADVLPQLAADHGMGLRFLTNAAEERLLELGGLAGLLRW